MHTYKIIPNSNIRFNTVVISIQIQSRLVTPTYVSNFNSKYSTDQIQMQYSYPQPLYTVFGHPNTPLMTFNAQPTLHTLECLFDTFTET